MNRKNFVKSLYIVLLVLSVLMVLLGFSMIWCLRTWQHLKMDELIFELTAPLKGTGGVMIAKFVLNCIVPTVVTIVAAAIIGKMTAKRYPSRIRIFRIALPIISFVFASLCFVAFWKRLEVTDYIANTGDYSTFIEDNYVDAGKVDLTFPEKDRNLIYIFLESMETTYSDKADGGGFDRNCIPELTQLAKENECFSADGSLNGGIVLPGTTWTMGGMFAQTSGLPLKLEIGENMMKTQKNFFPDITVLGDILKDRGYEQVLELGSDIEFGGRKVYFGNHGDYTIHDYHYAQDKGIIPEDYYVFWGFEDEKLFENARNDLTELAKNDKPFNFTLLTVDTHFEDGYICRLCKDEFGDDQYANVMACSSRQVADFVEWIKQQDFYDNTTIVICGDHTTMDSDFCENVSEDYLRRSYMTIINPAVSKTRVDESIQYSTMDMFPTTLAAMGVTIEGNRLGLGVNLFSDEKTIVEKYGLDKVNSELKKGSRFMDSLSGVVITEELLKKQHWAPDANIDIISYDTETKMATIEVRDISNVNDIEEVNASLYNSLGVKLSTVVLKLMPDRSYMGEISLEDLSDEKGKIVVRAKGADGTVKLGTLKGTLSYFAHADIVNYIGLLKNRDNIAVLVGSRNDVIKRTQPPVFEALADLGISLKLDGSDGNSFYAVIEDGKTTEEMGEGAVSCEGTLSDGAQYYISSATEEAGDECIIKVDGEDHAKNKRGINFVIYDLEKHEVVDTVCFNVSPKKYTHPYCHTSVEIKGDKAQITLSRLKRIGELDKNSVRVEIWDGSHPDKVTKADLSLTNDKTFTGEIDISDMDISDSHVRVYIYEQKSKVEKLSVKWDGPLEELKDYKWHIVTPK